MARPANRSYESNTKAARKVININSRPRQPRPRLRFSKSLLEFGAILLLLAITGILFLVKPHFPSLFHGSSSSGNGAGGAVAIQVTPQEAAVPVPSGQTKILLLGSDQRTNDPGFRTDVIILVTLDPEKKTVSAVSFPRDLWVKVPSLYEMKINQVFDLGGFKAMAEMFQANFGVTPDYYVLTNFSGFTEVIDSQGGVDVDVAQELSDRCDLPQAVNGSCTVKPGTVHMDGATALWYVRSRHTTSDFDRLRRAQEVLYALFRKMLNVGTIAKLPELKAQFDQNVQTDISISQAISFVPFATGILASPDRIHRFAITEDEATPSWSWNGMWILLPNTDAIHQLLLKAGIHM